MQLLYIFNHFILTILVYIKCIQLSVGIKKLVLKPENLRWNVVYSDNENRQVELELLSYCQRKRNCVYLGRICTCSNKSDEKCDIIAVTLKKRCVRFPIRINTQSVYIRTCVYVRSLHCSKIYEKKVIAEEK